MAALCTGKERFMNFSYLKQFKDMQMLYKYCEEADEFAVTKPDISAASARKALEFIVKFIYTAKVSQIYKGMNLFDMINDYHFQDYVNDTVLMSTIHYIRKMGNVAAHTGGLKIDESLKVLEELHFLVGEFCMLIGLVEDYPEFVKPGEQTAALGNVAEADSTSTEKDIFKTEQIKKEIVTPPEDVVARFAPRMRETHFNTSVKRSEEENKRMFLQASLREAGWPLASIKNQPVPGAVGVNMLFDDGSKADYILYGRDNKPLAVIEYTITKENIVEGREAAQKYADKLAEKYGYKPVAYYTNGYSIFVIDQLGYPPRRVFQFHSIEELELLKWRAGNMKDISDPEIDEEITGRDYQKEAIKAVCRAFENRRRHSLLVMATGTGKTRVAISLSGILMKANYVKNILFLADRTSLVRQAHKNFNKLLPSVTTSMYTGGNDERDPMAKIIFSTYQTMINLINDETREFGTGRFDLIIIDEAHRSIFKKYKSLFTYFDSLMIGLTATPRSEENKNTYEIFKLPDGEPDYAYELEDAIDQGYLTGFSVLDRTTDLLRRKVRYDQLTDEERMHAEDDYSMGEEDLDEYDDDSSAYAEYTADINGIVGSREVINIGTINAMLNDLMKNGLKVNGGDVIGKSIIFAKSHAEAEVIVNQFSKIYPYMGNDFCKLIDSKVDDSLQLIDNFGMRENLPQIAVSVDMLDTGIDVPDILNLVFFKVVKSKIKFLQMVGRGTRLSPDVYGPGIDKKGFIIFDYFDNFNYFNTHNTWSAKDIKTGWNVYTTSQSQLIYRKQLSILRQLTERALLTTFEENYRDKLRTMFIDSVNGLCSDDIDVTNNMAFVNKYRKAENWNHLNDASMNELTEHVLPLFPAVKGPAKVKTFDLMLYVIEDEAPKRLEANKDVSRIKHGFGSIEKKMDEMMVELSKLKSIPAVAQKEDLINKMHHAKYVFNNFSIEKCESVRKELRQIIGYIPDKKTYCIVDVDDYIIDDVSGSGNYATEKSYSEKAYEYIQKGSPALSCIRNLDELSDEQKQELDDVFKSQLGTEADYMQWSGGMSLLPFLRKQVGIADEAIKVKFGEFLNDNVLDEEQLEYMNQIISYARENGDITFRELQTVSPFNDIDVSDLFTDGTIMYVKNLVNGLHGPVYTAVQH